MGWSLIDQTSGTSVNDTSVTIAKSFLAGVLPGDILMVSGWVISRGNNTENGYWDSSTLSNSGYFSPLGASSGAWANDPTGNKDTYSYFCYYAVVAQGDSQVGNWTFGVNNGGGVGTPQCVNGVRLIAFRTTLTGKNLTSGYSAPYGGASVVQTDPGFGVGMDAQADPLYDYGVTGWVVDGDDVLWVCEVAGVARYDQTASTIAVTASMDIPGATLDDIILEANDVKVTGYWGYGPGEDSPEFSGTVTTSGTKCGGVLAWAAAYAEHDPDIRPTFKGSRVPVRNRKVKIGPLPFDIIPDMVPGAPKKLTGPR